MLNIRERSETNLCTTGTSELNQMDSESCILLLSKAKLAYLSTDVIAVSELELRFGLQ